MKEVVITIDPTGNVQVEANGCKGSECKDLTRDIEKALGKTVQDTKKPEFHQQASQGNNATLGGGF